MAIKLWEMLVRHRQVLPVQVQLFGETVSRLFHFFGFQLLQLQLSFQLSGALLEMVHRLLKTQQTAFKNVHSLPRPICAHLPCSAAHLLSSVCESA